MTLFAYLAARWRRVLAIPHDIHAWLYRDRIAAALDYENAHQHRAAIRADKAAFDRALHAEAERIAPDRRLDLYGKPWGGPWPADLCAYPPCDPEDGWQCVTHKPAANGRHLRVAGQRTDAER